MRLVSFDKIGVPITQGIAQGSVLLVVRRRAVYVVKLQVVGMEFMHSHGLGPFFDHANNQSELADDALALIAEHHPELLETDERSVLECPSELASRAIFDW